MSKLKLFITTLLALLIIAGTAGLASFIYISSSIQKQFGESGQIKEFQVKSGEGVKSVSRRFEESGLISSDFVFQIYVWQQNASGKIQAGDYEIPTGANMPAILEMLVGGKVKSNSFKITFPEGFNSQQIAAKVQNSLPIGGQAKFKVQNNFNNLVAAPSRDLVSKYWFLQGGNIKNLEGFLFPDTYEFEAGAEAEDIVEKMLDNFERKIEPLQGQIKSNKMNLYEILTLASIVEKEVSSVEDMRMVAGLFLRRLEIGILLQSDATINHITNKGMPSPLYKDLEVDSPYNTYKYAGLPPGPICNPGINAIKAVLDPIKTDYLYFLTPPDKPTVYSRTNAEHEANKQKWLK